MKVKTYLFHGNQNETSNLRNIFDTSLENLNCLWYG